MSVPLDIPLAAPGTRRFGHFELRALLGRSERTMSWHAFDARRGRDVALTLPRAQPGSADALAAWLDDARRAARVEHPSIAPVLEVGVHEHWAFVASDRAHGSTLPERLAAPARLALADAARWVGECLQALAYVHDAGFVHGDIQSHLLVIDDNGRVRLLGLGAVHMPVVGDRHAQREAAERDVLAAGVLLHTLLAGRPALDTSDVGHAIDRLAPRGRESLRLPRVTPVPLPAALRAIVDRATSSQLRLRYRSARTLQHALDGWREAHERADAGPIARLLDRTANVGCLPALPGVSVRAARLTAMERSRTHEMAEAVLEDFALALELLRLANGAEARAVQAVGSGPVLTVRRAIAWLGLDAVRHAAAGLRVWPGPLSDGAADELRALVDRVRLAGRVAVAIRPAGFDAEVVFVVTLLQNLGRLAVRYHFADEAAQIQQLMQPAPPEREGEAEQSGLNESDAACAVLGADIEALGSALARHWGFAADVLQLVRRLKPTLPVRSADDDSELIRTAASCANEAVDALALPVPRQGAAIERIAQRYGKVLGIVSRDLHEALQQARSGARARLDEVPLEAAPGAR